MSRRALILLVSLVSVLAVFAVYFGLYERKNQNINITTQAADSNITLDSEIQWTAGDNRNTKLDDPSGTVKMDIANLWETDFSGWSTTEHYEMGFDHLDLSPTCLTNAVSPPSQCIGTPHSDSWAIIDMGAVRWYPNFSYATAILFNSTPYNELCLTISSSLDNVTYDTLYHQCSTPGNPSPNLTPANTGPFTSHYLKVEFTDPAGPDFAYGFGFNNPRFSRNSATHTSAATQLDAGAHTSMNWTTFVPSATIPANTSIKFRFRTSTDAATWGSWTALTSYAASIDLAAALGDTNKVKRYLQVETTLANTDGASTPTLSAYTANYEYQDLDHVTVVNTGGEGTTRTAGTTEVSELTAHAWDSSDVEITPAIFSWSATCGTVTSTGAATANYVPPSSWGADWGSCVVTATTTIGGITKSGTITFSIRPCGTDIVAWFAPGVQPGGYHAPIGVYSYAYKDRYGCGEGGYSGFCYNRIPNATYSYSTTCGTIGSASDPYDIAYTAPNNTVATYCQLSVTSSCGGSDTKGVSFDGISYTITPTTPQPEPSPTPTPTPEPTPTPAPTPEPEQETCIGPLCYQPDNNQICIGSWCFNIPFTNPPVTTPEGSLPISEPVTIVDSNGNGQGGDAGDEICSGDSCIEIPPDGETICIGDKCVVVDGEVTINDTDGDGKGDELCSGPKGAPLGGGKCIPIPEGGLILDGPLAIAANSALVAAIAGGIALLALLFSGLGSALTMLTPAEAAGQIFSSIGNFFGRVFGIFAKGKEKKKAKIGLVYDAVSSLPIPMAKILLFRARDNKLIRVVTSDKDGRFALETPAGEEYFIEVKKFGFALLSGANIIYKTALAYQNNYTGGTFRPAGGSTLFSQAIPMRYSAEASILARKSRAVERFAKVFRILNIPILIFGFLLSILALKLSHGWFNTSVFIIYLVIFAYYLSKRYLTGRSYGLVYSSANNAPVELAVVRAISEINSKLVKTTVADAKGKYTLALPKGYYKLIVSKPSLEQANPLAIRVQSSFAPRKEKIGMVERKNIEDRIENIESKSKSIPVSGQAEKTFADAREIVENYNEKNTKYGTADLANLGVHHLIENQPPVENIPGTNDLIDSAEVTKNDLEHPNWQFPSPSSPM